MTDEQIIKGVECCADQSKRKACQECPYNTKGLNCVRYILVDAFSLIQRQKAEIERMTEQLKTARADVVREFADRLLSGVVRFCDIERVVREMTEGEG